MNFWEQLPAGFTCLAPMEGVTDIAFRQVIARAARPDIFFTEFTNVNSFVSQKGHANALERLRVLPSEQPIIAQLWGTNPDYFLTTINALDNLGFYAVDINMGCPDRHVVATGGGSGLIRTPALAQKIIRTAKKGPLPVSVKTRLGYSKPDEWRDWLSLLFSENLAALTIHLRTKKEMSKVPAHYELIPDILSLRDHFSPKTKLIINGDFKNSADALPYFNLGVDGIMIGRGVFQNPFCFANPSHFPTRKELINLALFHLELYEKYQLRPYDPLKHFFKIYINHFPGASALRARLMETHSIPEARAIIEEIHD